MQEARLPILHPFSMQRVVRPHNGDSRSTWLAPPRVKDPDADCDHVDVTLPVVGFLHIKRKTRAGLTFNMQVWVKSA